MVGAHGLISVDTGSMHLGSALGIPVLALFGPTDPGLTGPYRGSAISRVMTSGVDCQPCVKTALQKSCGFNRCMQELSPESVFEAFEGLLWQIPKPLNPPGRGLT
jgi:ADP-heptose:LPS heptosyltransferase